MIKGKKEPVQSDIRIPGMSRLDEKKLDDIFSQIYCKSESNNLKFYEFIYFTLDKGLLSSKHNLQFYFDLFQNLYEEEEKIAVEEIQVKKNSITTTKAAVIVQKEEKQPPRFTCVKFMKCIDILGKTFFKSNQKSLELILKEILMERSERSSKIQFSPFSGDLFRVLQFDDLNKRIISEKPIQTILLYTQDVQGLFVQYQPENYGKQEIMLFWSEVKMMNLRMPSYMFIQMLNDYKILPQIISTEMLVDVFIKIIPSVNQKENQFYQAGNLEKISEKIFNNRWNQIIIDGDPKISFFEFQILLARLAVDQCAKDNQFDIKKELIQPITYFYETKLMIATPRSICFDSQLKPVQLLQSYYNQIQAAVDNCDQSIKNQEKSQDFSQASFQKIREENYNIATAPHPKMEMNEIVQIIQSEFPQLPQFRTLENLNSEYGKKIQNHVDELKRKEEAKKSNTKGAKKPMKKSNKDKEPQREISIHKNRIQLILVWEPINPERQLDSYQHFIEFQNDLEFNANQFQDLRQLTSISFIQSAPVLLPEVLYPVDMPPQVQPFIESAILFFSQQNYYSAFTNYDNAKKLWSKLIYKEELPDQTMIYFEFVEGQVYEIAGQDAAAMNKFMKVKYHSDKVLINHPDRALPFCGFGSVFYHTQEYELSLRSFLKAKEIRDNTIGSENIENAIIYNNMGCCLHQLGHFYDAETSFKFAEALFDIHLGQFHRKTLTAKRNLQKLIKDSRTQQ